MIPRLKPALSRAEFAAALRPGHGAVERFEQEFAGTFGNRHAIAFPYGRTALWAVLRALDIHDSELVMPAYTCVVVAHAAVLSGNEPRFVDVRLDDYTMDLDRLAEVITERTAAVVPTHLFGYPMDVGAVTEIVRDAERRFGRRIVIIQDCAHSFGASFRGQAVTRAPDMALFGLNISKMITSIFGGMLTTDDDGLASRIRAFRDQAFTDPGSRRLRRLVYLAAVYPAFNRVLYGAVEWLQDSTPVLDRFTKAYHLDDRVRFPPDHLQLLSNTEAAVGLVQLGKYESIVSHRRGLASIYHDRMQGTPGLIPAPLVEGGTYSHFVARTPHRDHVRAYARRRGVQLGEIVEYSVPDVRPYRRFARGDYPNARVASRSMINLPVHAGVSNADALRVAALVRAGLAGHERGTA
jgi:perosamine synthetase